MRDIVWTEILGPVRGHELEDFRDVTSSRANQASSIELEPMAPSMRTLREDIALPAQLSHPAPKLAQPVTFFARQIARVIAIIGSRLPEPTRGSWRRKAHTGAPGSRHRAQFVPAQPSVP